MTKHFNFNRRISAKSFFMQYAQLDCTLYYLRQIYREDKYMHYISFTLQNQTATSITNLFAEQSATGSNYMQ